MTFHSPRLKCLLIMLPLQRYYSQYTVAICDGIAVCQVYHIFIKLKNRSRPTHKDSPQSSYDPLGEPSG